MEGYTTHHLLTDQCLSALFRSLRDYEACDDSLSLALGYFPLVSTDLGFSLHAFVPCIPSFSLLINDVGRVKDSFT